jgi:hypothetical protein
MADQIRATPQNATLGAIANLLKQTYAPQRTQQMQGMMEFLGLPALARTVERVSYGEPVTNINKANVPLLPADTAEAAMLAGPPLASLAKRVGTNLVQTAPYVARDMAQSMSSPLRSYVVKPKGGNWLAGSVEHAVEPMQKRVTQAAEQNFNPAQGMTFREIYSQDALNKWLETKLGKYIRNEMATPEDPLRALAERGIMHSEITPTGYNVARARQQAGFPEEGMGVSPMAKAWEDRADTFINELKASDLTSGYPEAVESNPWLLKVPPETRVYDMLRGADEDLGFSHLTDELRNAINPESGLPRELMLKYSDLEKVTVPQAVERVAKINDWRAAQKAEADMARAMGPATQVVKEYPDQGYKWVELRQPKETGRKVTVERSDMELPDMTPEMMREVAEDMAYDAMLDPGTREFNNHVEGLIADFSKRQKREVDESYKALEDALKYEGETMGHCVGGYCPDVSEGLSKIFSLRDKKGQPHVTIEVSPRRPTVEQATKIAIDEGLPPKGMETLERVAQIMSDPAFSTQDIVQIKGKGNKAPKEDYLPAVQDFVRSGNFGKVGDLGNTGLVDVSQAGPLMKALQDIYGRNMSIGMEKFNAAADATPDAQRFMTKDELLKFLGETPPEGFARGGAVRGYQAGGIVKAAKKTARSLGDLVDEYVRKVRKFDELGEPSYDVKKPEAPTSADVPGWHITQDLASILKAGAINNRLAGSNMQGYDPAHLGGAYFYSDPRLSLAQHQRLMDMVGSDPAYAAELPILRAQLRRGNRLVPDEDVGLNVPWQQSYQEGSFATKRPVLINQIDRIYSADPGVTKDMIRDTIIRQRRPGYAEGGAVTGANFPTDDYDPARIDAIVAGLQAEMQS